MDVLLLNADATPLSHVLLSVVTWEVAMRLVFLEKARVLKEYEHWTIRSQYLAMKVPSIIIMTKQVKWNKALKYNRDNVYLRDDFTCQLQTTQGCKEQGGKVRLVELTLDHVVPRSNGGKTSWTNVCTSCKECNSQKGNDAKIVPKKMPEKPSYYEIVAKRKKLPINLRDAEWQYYVDWDPNLINILPQPGENGR